MSVDRFAQYEPHETAGDAQLTHALLRQMPALPQAIPQRPQLFGSEVVLTSQPFVVFASQLAKPALHSAIAHAPAVHVAVALGNEHVLPHTPQLFTLVCVLTSQPLLAIRSQSAKPALQLAIAHAPAVQVLTAFASAHVRPHAPQLDRLLFTSISQPFVATRSQSRKPGLHPTTPHTPSVQLTSALGSAHVRPQPPQCARLVLVSTQIPEQLVSGEPHVAESMIPVSPPVSTPVSRPVSTPVSTRVSNCVSVRASNGTSELASLAVAESIPLSSSTPLSGDEESS